MALKLNKRVTSMISPSHCLSGVACITGNLDKTMSDHTRADLDLNFNFYGRSEDRGALRIYGFGNPYQQWAVVF